MPSIGAKLSSPKLSVQLYSVRDELAQDLGGTLARLAGLGFTRAEAFGFVGRTDLAPALRAAGLQTPTGHARLLSPEQEGPSLAETFDAAAELGMEIVIDPIVAPERWSTPSDVARTADLLNRAGQEAATRGLRVGYHNHDHEFAHSFDGVSAYEHFVTLLDDAVTLELDLYWAAVAGAAVPGLVERLGSRLAAVHVKDGALAAPRNDDDQVLGQVPAGTGEVPLADAVAAARDVEYAILEFDHFEGDTFAALGDGVAWLRDRGIA